MSTKEETYQEACDYYVSRFEDIAKLLRVQDHAQQLDHDTWAEECRERIEEMPLSVECETIDLRGETMQWSILLGTGGPADRVRVTTDYHGTVEDAVYEYQNWFTPWTEPLNQDRDLVRAFAEVFYYSELRDVVAGQIPGVLP